ncbi:MAG: right-handed parallel beta-helix repeat-containing protein [Candidatus Methylarchaceae archaeon HK02M2]|nr:right-handed parallel beta-helix repeat-containing protein [Candidatus Methylarchaceae archaeon HK02M2]
MKKLTGTVIISMFLIMPLLLAVPTPVFAQPQEALSDAVGGGTGGTFWLDPAILYTGGVTITGDTSIYGQGAMIDLQESTIEVTGAYLYIEKCTITNGTFGAPSTSGGLEFKDGASGFVYNNIIVGNNDNGIYIEESSNIIIKENSILHNYDDGIKFIDSTDITILENIIENNDIGFKKAEECGIFGYNSNLYEEDPNSHHNIMIKGNKIVANKEDGIYLKFVNGVSIASNLIFANYGDGIGLDYCPITSITHNKILVNYEYDFYCGIHYSGDRTWDPDEIESSITVSYNKIMGNIGTGVYIENTKEVVITYNQIMWNEGGGVELHGSYLPHPDPSSEVLFVIENILIAYNTISENGGGVIVRDGAIIFPDNGIHNEFVVNTFVKMGKAGIYMSLVSDPIIIYNKIMGNRDRGIEIYGHYFDYYATLHIVGENLLIKGNIINGNGGDGISVEYFNSPVIIEWNTILGNGGDGIELYFVENPQILHNTIMYQLGYLDMSPAPCGLDIWDCEGAWIAYNTIAYNVQDNIYVMSSDDVIIEYNTIIGSTDDGINAEFCEDMTIQDNTVYDNEEDGIDWFLCSGLIANNIVGYSGSLSGNDNGISLTDCLSTMDGPTTISDNTIIGNEYGIHCFGSDPTIIGNYIANNVWGIYLQEGAGLASDATIGGTPDNRNYIIRNYKDGVFIADMFSNPTINYNNIFENVGYGANNFMKNNNIDAENNYWGDISGPGNPATFGVGPGSGDEISKNLTYSPWLVTIIP